MKKAVTAIFLFIYIAVLAGCFYVPGVAGNGKAETREMPLTQPLTGVDNMDSFEVTIDPSLSGKAVFDGESNILDLMDSTQNEKGVLELAFKPGTNLMTVQSVKVRVPAVNGGLIRASGSGNILIAGDGVLTGDTFTFETTGSGTIDVAVDAKAISATLSGSGDITLSGSAGNQTVRTSGSGNYKGFACKGNSANVGIQGSGRAEVYTDTSLTGLISGSGDIIYDGNPAKVDISGQGSGKATKK